jgi:hypothetical protein
MMFRTGFFPIDLFVLIKTEDWLARHCADNGRQFKLAAAVRRMTLE